MVTEFDTFAEYLGRTGEITFFPRNPIYQKEMAELRDWVVLKPDWLLQQAMRLHHGDESGTTKKRGHGD